MVTDLEVVEIEDCLAIKDSQPGSDSAGGLLVQMPNDEEEWIPKSQIHEDSEVYREGTSGTLIIAKFIADKKGITDLGTVTFIGP